MRIDSIRATNLLGFDVLDLQLPQKGVIVVTGRNGQGKSSLVEAVAAGLWGETLRGTRYWRRGQPCEIEVLTDVVRVIRSVDRKGDKALRFSSPPTEPAAQKHATVREAQRALDSLLPPWPVFRRASVFSSADAALFSTATDSERKTLLERVLGLERFEPAVKACREALAAARAEAQAAEDAAGRERAVLAERQTWSENLGAIGCAIDPYDVEQAAFDWLRMCRVHYEAEALKPELEHARGQTAIDERTLALLEHQARAARKAAIEAAAERCPMPFCRAWIDPEVAWQLRRDADEAERVARRARADEEARVARVRRRVARLEDRLAQLRTTYKALRDSVKQADWAIERASAEAKAKADAQAALAASVAEAEASIQAARQRAQEARQRALVLEVTEQVLGLRGVRSALLGDALAGLELLTTRRLGRVFPDLTIEVKAKTERRTKTVDAISIVATGVGDDAGYHALSGGQRRRVDMTLMMSLAELADAAAGANPGTLWFDEVFDALDREGVDAFSELLIELAEQRQVVVISHNYDLIASLLPAAAARLQVEDGKVLVQ